jgi:hypothetical protein
MLFLEESVGVRCGASIRRRPIAKGGLAAWPCNGLATDTKRKAAPNKLGKRPQEEEWMVPEPKLPADLQCVFDNSQTVLKKRL